ncbi:MAG: glycosyltransferase [Gemmatimonadetes bacterium]|nr:glycosyltransferase [Gemmatimonadota bacterium]
MSIAVVIPVRDRAALLERCLGALREAAAQAERHGAGPVRVVVADHGSRDGTVAVAERFAPLVSVAHSRARTVAGVRNDGAAAAEAALDPALLVFLDADCIVPPGFLVACGEVLAETGGAAAGCEVVSPADGHWTERTWDAIHRPGGDGRRYFINSACFAVRSAWFRRIGGWDAERTTSEDVDICRRLTIAGGRMDQSERLAVLHLGNPQSVAGVYRRVRWHSEGVAERGRAVQWSRYMVATLGHALLAVGGTGAAAWLLWHGDAARAALALVAGWFLMPLLFVVARAVQYRRWMPWMAGTALMAITFPARLHGMARGWWRSVRRRAAATTPPVAA